ncbi:MAG: hypothetical protein JO323_17835 [Acidobacteriia bacterium]|nr:hypothetical protein [Terriglobia bacterium]
MSIDHWQDQMINITYNLCSIVTMPVELALRPFHGTRYFPPIVMLLSMAMMIVIPTFFSFVGAVGNAIPFHRTQASFGMIGMWGFSKLFFLGLAIHGVRKWRLMWHMEREENSYYSGPPLFFFSLLPKASFWRIKIVYEPLFLLVSSILLGNFFILEPGAVNFLTISAIFLAMKNYTRWYMEWQFIRELMDAKFMGPKLARLAENPSDEEDLGSFNLASFPKDLPPDVRKSFLKHMAHVVSGENDSN